MRTSPSPTCDAVTIVVFHVVAHSLHIVQTLASPALHSSPAHLRISCAGLDTVLLWNMSYILRCSLHQSPFVNKSLSTEQLDAKYNRLINQYTITYDTQCCKCITLDSHPLCYENHTSPPVANFTCNVCVHILPGWSFFVSAMFLNSSGTFWAWNIVHYLLQQYPTTFFRSPEKLLCVDYCCFHNNPSTVLSN